MCEFRTVQSSCCPLRREDGCGGQSLSHLAARLKVPPFESQHGIAKIHLWFFLWASRWMSAASSAELQLPGTFIYFSTSPVFKFPGSCSDDRSHLCATFLEKWLRNSSGFLSLPCLLLLLLLTIIRPQIQMGEAVHSVLSRELCNARAHGRWSEM